MCTCMWFALPRPRYTGQEEISSLPTGLFKSRPQLPPPSGLFADNASPTSRGTEFCRPYEPGDGVS